MATNTSAAPNTKKRKLLTLEERVKVIRLSESGESSRKISIDFAVGKTQVNNIIKNKAEIIKQWESGEASSRKIVKARRCLYPDLNLKVYDWFCTARSKNIPVTGKMLQEKATLLALELDYDAQLLFGALLCNMQLHLLLLLINVV
jgi:hypothetical protein